MPWNPDVYNQFKSIRYKPFFDLMGLISDENLQTAVDIGCGTGEQTKILSEKFENAEFIGIDNSPEMLNKSKEFSDSRVSFENKSVDDFINEGKTYDLIFSNAALQWAKNHLELFPKLLALVNDGGQVAVQMPNQDHNILNKILFDLANEEPFRCQLNYWNRISPVLTLDAYTELLFSAGFKDLNVSERVYPIIAEDADTLFNFISGSALIPYQERLSENHQAAFKEEFKNRIQNHFKKFPAVYPFKRILIYGRKIN